MSLLTIIQDAAVFCNLPEPSSVINSSDVNVPLLLRLANQEGQELSRRHDWKIMTAPTFSFTSLATEEQTSFPASFDRLLPNPELWNQSQSKKYSGPIRINALNQLNALLVTSGSPGWWYLGVASTVPYGPTIYIIPAPTAGETLAIPYVSNEWCSDSGFAVFSNTWTADTDVGNIPERLMTLGIIWRWKKAKGLDYAEDMATYEREVDRACTRDRGVNVLRLHRSRLDDLPPPTWPGTIV